MQMEDKYLFRREDTGEVIELDFVTMMTMDSMGCVTLDDGVVARRARDLDPQLQRAEIVRELEKPVVSDSLGFTEKQLADFEADRKRHGFTGVEFKRDPDVPQFFQVHCSGKAEWDRYVKHRGMNDCNSMNGGRQALSERDLRAAEQKVRERYGDPTVA
jgi:hypothetical protein